MPNLCESCCKHISKSDEVKKRYKNKDVYFHSKCWDKIK
jgi:hypothetical protein